MSSISKDILKKIQKEVILRCGLSKEFKNSLFGNGIGFDGSDIGEISEMI